MSVLINTPDDGTIDTIDLSDLEEGVIIDLDLNTPGPENTQEGAILDAPGGNVVEEVIDVENVIGTQGDDLILGNNELNVLEGGAGDDAIHSFAGADTLDGGEGIDTALFTAGGGAIVDLDEDGNAESNFGDVLIAFEAINGSAAGDDSLSGNDAPNQLFGNGGNDTLDGEGGADTLIGGEGDDLIVSDAIDTVFGGNEIDLEDPGADLITDDGGVDTIDLSGLEEGVVIDLDLNTPGPENTQEGAILDAPGGNVVTDVIDVENVIGTQGDDLILGNNELNVLEGGAGDDAIHSFAGADTLDGGEGIDTALFTAGGGVTVDLDENGDAISSFNDQLFSFENINGSAAGDDSISGNSADNVLFGNGGDDTLVGELGDDTLIGGEGVDTADFSDIDAPITVAIDADGNGTVTRDTGFSVTVTDAEVNAATGLTDAEFVAEAVAGNLYFNIHTADFPGGEIRGQLFVTDDTVDENGVRTIVLEGGLDAAQEPGPTSDSEATGSGTVTIVVDAEGNATYSSTLDVTGLVESDLLSPVPGAVSAIHLHNAPAGENGPIVQDTLVDAGGTLATEAEVADNPTGVLEDVVENVSEINTLESIERVIGSDDADTVDLSAFDGVTVDLDLSTPTPNLAAIGGEGPQDGAIIVDGAIAIELDDFENVIGSDGDDLILGNNELNVLEGGAGNDAIHSFAGADTLDGGEGIDTALFTAGGGAIVDLDEDGNAESNFGDVLIAFENINGSAAGDDSLSGNDDPNQLFGNGGNDTLDGEGGSDTLIGGEGDDLIVSDALDTVFGGNAIDLEDPDADLSTDDGGIDTIDFSTLEAGIADFGPFDGIIVDLDVNSAGPAGTPSQEGGVLSAPPGAVAVEGVVPDENILQSVIDIENVIGSAFNDGLFGNNEVNVLQGGAGNDAIHGFANDDFLAGGEGTDTVLFAAAVAPVIVNLNDQVSEEDFAAIAAGDLAAQFVATGGAGNNVLSGFENVTGGSGDDDITGDDNDNILNGNGGSNTLNGGAGLDTAVFSGNQADFEIDQADDGSVTVANLAAGVIDTLTDIEVLSFADGDVTVADLFDDVVDVDVVVGSAGADIILGGLDIDAVEDIVLTGADDDTVDLPLAAVGAADNIVLTGSGNDQIFVSSGDIVSGGSGDDLLDATDSGGGNRLSGGAGDDIFILGVAGGDRFLGGAGDDTFLFAEGGEGGNILAGGSGADIFALSPGEATAEANIITDFDVTEDVFVGIGFADVTLEGSNVLVGEDVVVTVLGVDATTLTEANFV